MATSVDYYLAGLLSGLNCRETGTDVNQSFKTVGDSIPVSEGQPEFLLRGPQLILQGVRPHQRHFREVGV